MKNDLIGGFRTGEQAMMYLISPKGNLENKSVCPLNPSYLEMTMSPLIAWF